MAGGCPSDDPKDGKVYIGFLRDSNRFVAMTRCLSDATADYLIMEWLRGEQITEELPMIKFPIVANKKVPSFKATFEGVEFAQDLNGRTITSVANSYGGYSLSVKDDNDVSSGIHTQITLVLPLKDDPSTPHYTTQESVYSATDTYCSYTQLTKSFGNYRVLFRIKDRFQPLIGIHLVSGVLQLQINLNVYSVIRGNFILDTSRRMIFTQLNCPVDSFDTQCEMTSIAKNGAPEFRVSNYKNGYTTETSSRISFNVDIQFSDLSVKRFVLYGDTKQCNRMVE